MPHVVIAGAGALGCLAGGLLAEGGLKVTLLSRRPEQVAAIQTGGLRLTGFGGERTVRIGATTRASEIGPTDAVLVLCKSRDTGTLAHAVRPLFQADGCVAVSLQNGLGNEAALAAVLGAERVLGGVTALGATLEAPNLVRAYDDLPTRIGEMRGGQSARADGLADLLTRYGLPTAASGDIVADIWCKLLLNVALSATTALTDLPIGDVLAIPSLRRVAERAVDETRAVAAACGVTLPTGSDLALFEAIAGSGAAANRTSMCRDVRAGRPSEVDAIYHVVIRDGQYHGVVTPTLDTLAALIDGVESRHG